MSVPVVYTLPLNPIALVGYCILLLFALFKLTDTVSRPVDLIGNLLLITGCGTLIVYHFRKIREDKDEKNDQTQKVVRQIAHASFVVFFLLTLTPMSAAIFRFYDVFGILGHASLFVTVLLNRPQLLGVGLLAFYFLFGLRRKIGLEGMELLNTMGRSLLFVFFTVSFMAGVIDNGLKFW
jgi:hypothetical protein